MFLIKTTAGIDFSYHDSGPPLGQDTGYKTLVVVHGNTYLSNTFLSMFTLASAHKLRIILPNRRLYPGSTPYTNEEAKSLSSGTIEEISATVEKQGEHLALFIDAIAQEHKLDNIIVAGWSLGAAFVTMIVDSITRIKEPAKARLQKTVRAFIVWDPPSTVMGFEDPATGGWTPLYDLTLTPEQRGFAFAQWLNNYFPHPDVTGRDPTKLIYKLDNPEKTPSFKYTPFEMFLSFIDPTANTRGDIEIGEPQVRPVMLKITKRGLLNDDVHKTWKNATFWCIFGDESPWNVIWSAWHLEDMSKASHLKFGIKTMKGVNHFSMADNPELVLATIDSCIA